MDSQVGVFSYVIDHDKILSVTFDTARGTLKFVPRAQCKNDKQGVQRAQAELEKYLEDLISYLINARRRCATQTRAKRDKNTATVAATRLDHTANAARQMIFDP